MEINSSDWIYFKSEDIYYRIRRFNLDRWVASGFFFTAYDIECEQMIAIFRGKGKELKWMNVEGNCRWKPLQSELTTLENIKEELLWESIK